MDFHLPFFPASITRKAALALAIAAMAMFSAPRADAAVTVTSANGYQVTIDILLIQLVPHTNPCTYGYNYDVKLSYTITFSGPNQPSNLYTLQGTVGCGSNSLFFSLPKSPASGTVTTTSNAWRGVADCNTATLASLGCNTVKVQIEGPGISNRTITVPTGILPIELVEFRADPAGSSVGLSWATASEKDNAWFTVERSVDAVDFSPVLRMPGAGNSSEMLLYEAKDEAPLPGISYYRLRQTDLNGAWTLSPTVVVETKPDGTFTIFPNPGSGSAIRLPAGSDGQYVEVRSAGGALLLSELLSSCLLDVSGMGPGIYLVTLRNPATGSLRHSRLVRLGG